MRILAAMLMMSIAGLACAANQAPTTATTKDQGVADGVKQLEKDWVDAMKAADVDKIGQIVADDWMGLSFEGKKLDKKTYITDVKSGKDKAESVELGPMDVKVMGKVAVVQGSDVEKSTTNGKDTSGKWVWMDVFVERDGKWVAVRSQSAMVK